MNTTPVIALLLLDAVLLVAVNTLFDRCNRSKSRTFLFLLFFCSGMPALIYQVVWQRALFAIYGVNAQSVAVIVTAFMVGLGIGSFVGGWLSSRFPRQGILIFGVAELGVAAFGLCSLRVFHWVAGYTAGSGLLSTVFFSLALLLIPTVLMGTTLPLLVEHLVLQRTRVGASVSALYFVNTFGSAVACYLCAAFLLRSFGQAGSVGLAVCMNTLVGAAAYIYGRVVSRHSGAEPAGPPMSSGVVPLPLSMMLAGLSGFVALGFEIIWFRIFAIASSDRAPAFALLLATYLAGIAAGCIVMDQLTKNWQPDSLLSAIGVLLVLAGGASVYLPPFVAGLMARQIPFLASTPAFFLTAALLGSVFPLLCQLSVPAGRQAGQGASLIYISNILGSALGSLGVGFVLLNRFGLKQMSAGLGLIAVLMGLGVFALKKGKPRLPSLWALALTAAALISVTFSMRSYSLLFERLVFGDRREAAVPFVQTVENRNGMIGVTREGAVFGGGVYDGHFNVDPTNDINLVARAYLVSSFCPAPKRILLIGLGSASWGQILANHPDVQALDTVEINPGYLQLIPKYQAVRSFLENPRVHIYIDDGRRWLLARPEERYDAIIANTSFNWRDHSSGLLSAEFLTLIRSHLNPGGIYYFNTTKSDETIATALHVFPYGLRVINFLAVSDSPIKVDGPGMLDTLRRYKIDGRPVLDPANPAAQRVYAAYVAMLETLAEPPRELGMESSDSLRKRLGRVRLITDDNMGLEWQPHVAIPWH